MIARRPALAVAAALVGAFAGCGTIASPDIFAITRVGGGRTLTLVVNDSGTARCNGKTARAISDSRLLQARKVANDLHDDASAARRFASAGTVYSYRYRSGDGAIVFSDRATARHPELARAVLFITSLADEYC